MTRKNRHFHSLALVLGAVAGASCASTPPAGDMNCTFMMASDGTLQCIANPVTESSTSSTSTGGGPITVPDLNPTSGKPSIPDLSPTTATPTSGPAATTAAGPLPTGDAPPVVTGDMPPAPTTTSGGEQPSGTGGTGDVGVGGAPPIATPGLGGMGTVPSGTGGTAPLPPASGLGSITVSAGEKARDHTIVTFPLPGYEGKNLVLEDTAGVQLPLQFSPADGNASFVLPALGAGESAVFTIVEVPEVAVGLTAVVEGEHLFVKNGTTNIFRWMLTPDNFRNRAANNVRSGYIYPLYTPGGLNVADDYAEDHPHMHGLWSAWTNTTFRNHKVDFWNGYNNQGNVDLSEMKGLWSGPVHAGLIAGLVHTDITTNPNVVVLNEQWIVTVYKTHDGASPYYVFDIDSTQETATSDPLILEQFHYGGFGFRGAQEWTTPANVSYLTSEGHTRANGDGQNARWCAQYGNINGAFGGYAALGHPTNVRAPQGLRIHPSNPFFAFLPSTPLAGGRFTIEVGVPYKSRFRVVTFDGDANADFLNSLYEDYATPPTVVVSPP